MSVVVGAVNEGPRWERRNLTRREGFQLAMRKINSSPDKTGLPAELPKPEKNSLVPTEMAGGKNAN